MCEHYIAHRLCPEYPDWSIAAAGSESSLRIGYEYARSVTGVAEISVDLEAYEEGTTDDHEKGASMLPEVSVFNK